MTSCNHTTLELLPEKKKRLRCRHCHLTINVDELGDGYCPECFETHGQNRYEFEEMEEIERKTVRYICEDCGVVIESE